MSETRIITVNEESQGIRLDKFLNCYFEDLSRSGLQKLIEEGFVTINGQARKSNYKLKGDEYVTVSIPAPVEPEIEPEDIPIDVVYEDDDLIIVNKPKNMVVHPANGHYTGTLVNALLYHCKDNLSVINGVKRPGIVHRIDMDTTGLLAVCKNDISHNALAEQLKDHTVNRTYHAIVKGCLYEDGTVDAPIGRNKSDRKKMAVIRDGSGKEAITHYHVIETFKNYTYIQCNLETGRTHQIRVHMAYINHPILGDLVYGHKDSRFPGTLTQTLHAKELELIHPSKGEKVRFTTDLPDYFQNILRIIKTNNY